MITSYATVYTAHAGEYLFGLSRSWRGALPLSGQTLSHVEIAFPIGRCALDAESDSLAITLTAPSNHDVALLEDLISDHLDRLASNEDLSYQWLRPTTEPIAPRRSSRSLYAH